MLKGAGGITVGGRSRGTMFKALHLIPSTEKVIIIIKNVIQSSARNVCF
jgi:hypothetical protein